MDLNSTSTEQLIAHVTAMTVTAAAPAPLDPPAAPVVATAVAVAASSAASTSSNGFATTCAPIVDEVIGGNAQDIVLNAKQEARDQA